MSSTPAPRTDRFAFIHALRGVAAMLVVWSHLSGFWLLENQTTSAAQDLWRIYLATPLHLFQNGGHLGVVLFFLISGFIITHTSLREDRRAFAIKRTLRIFPPLAVATLVCGLLLLVAAATETRLLGINGGDALHWISSLVLVDGFLPGGRALDVTWTLVIEVVFYALTFALLGLSRRSPLLSTAVMAVAWVLLSIAVTFVPIAVQTGNSGLAVYVGFLVLGRVIYLGYARLINRWVALGLGVAVALAFLGLTEYFSPGFLIAPGGWAGYEPIVSYGYALAIFMALMVIAPKRTVQPFTLLGDVSYSLYLLHLPIGITALNLLNLAGVPESVAVVIAIALAIAVSWLSWRFVEVPFQKLARTWVRRGTPIAVDSAAQIPDEKRPIT